MINFNGRISFKNGGGGGGGGGGAINLAGGEVLTRAARQEFRGIEESIRNLPQEYGFIVDDNGTRRLEKQGTADRVEFSWEEIARLKGASYTHNHPSGTSFSPDDVAIASRFGAKQLRAVGTLDGRKVTYTMTPQVNVGKVNAAVKNAQVDNVFALVRQIGNANSTRIWTRQTAQVNRGTISLSQAQNEHWHQVWSDSNTRNTLSRAGIEMNYQRIYA